MALHLTPIPPGAMAPLSEMHRACFPEDPWDAAALGRILGLPGCFGLLAHRGDAPAGFTIARDLGEEIEIITLGVLPDCRRQGVGRALLEAILEAPEPSRVASIVLEVAEQNEPARALYATMGFAQVGRRPRYYRRPEGLADALILRRAIARLPAAR